MHRTTVSCSLRERKGEIQLKQNTYSMLYLLNALTSLLSLSAPFVTWLLPWDQVAQCSWYSNTQTLLNCLLLQSAGGHVYSLNLLDLFTVLILIKQLLKEDENCFSASLTPKDVYWGAKIFFPLIILNLERKLPFCDIAI